MSMLDCNSKRYDNMKKGCDSIVTAIISYHNIPATPQSFSASPVTRHEAGTGWENFKENESYIH